MTETIPSYEAAPAADTDLAEPPARGTAAPAVALAPAREADHAPPPAPPDDDRAGGPEQPAAEALADPPDGDQPAAEDTGAAPGLQAAGIQAPGPSGFGELGLSEQILRAVTEMGYTTPTPIQRQAIPFVLMGRDVLGCAQTGTGKTAGFTLPMLDILSGSRARARMPRSLILEPTRELALQVAENFVMYGRHLRLTHALIIGGESMSDQRDVLMRGVDVLIATPGRLIDMYERGGILLSDCRVLVIDEADRMLDMGFIPDVERIVGLLPTPRQTLFFSATMAPEIRRLADAFLRNPKEISVAPPASVATTIIQAMTLVAEHDKREALRRLIRSEDVQNALIFCNRKRDVDILFKSLSRHGFSVGALHGDMAQSVRFATLDKFKAGDTRLLCCSDVAARGLDIGGLSHVFNFDVPIHSEDYVHRIGRTGRAGREGRAFMLATPDDRLAVEAIEKLTGLPIGRMQIPGLDPVEWAESDGRKRRRGKAVKAKEPARAKDAAKDGAREAAKDGAREAARDTPKQPARPKDAVKAKEAEKPGRRKDSDKDRPPAREARRGASSGPPPRAPAEPAVPAAEPAAVRPAREPRRAPADAPSPAVVGFGADVPAFMLVSAYRNRKPQHLHAEEMVR